MKHFFYIPNPTGPAYLLPKFIHVPKLSVNVEQATIFLDEFEVYHFCELTKSDRAALYDAILKEKGPEITDRVFEYMKTFNN